jgi:putative membrane protein
MTIAAPSSKTGPAIAAILLISAAATAFLFWLIYVHPAAASSTQYAFLPALNALLNGLSATALLIGYTFIKARRIAAHRAAMMTAFGFSTLFLVSYILHHALHGDVRYPAHAAWSTCRCWPATSCWPSWRCRWCWSRFSFH